ncbi:MAG: aminopeptidase [Promethearchaeota archaeon]|nr:MAG: aminopeptidase [Candidatus Lokiarchaeota archaeon]
MIDDKDYKICAENIVKAANISPGEFVFVRGGVYSQRLLEEIAINVYRKEAIPFINSTTDDYKFRFHTDENISIETLEKVPKHYLEMIKNIDTYIVIEPFEDPSKQTRIPREKLRAGRRAQAPIRDVLYGMKEDFAPGKKWVYAAWPSEAAAKFYGIDYKTYEKFIVEGEKVPLSELKRITKNIGKEFKNAKNVHVTDDYGTDFWISIEDRNAILDDGIIDEEALASGDLGGKLPAGEVFFPPIETKGEGVLFCPLTIDRFSNKIIRNVTLPFKNGRLDINKVTAEEGLEDLIDSFKHCEKLDMEQLKDEDKIRTYNVCELGIGCNPEITKAVAYILTDEKITGSVHLAFGGNNFFGGNSVSQMHWDFVTKAEANMKVEYKDGTKKELMKQGKFLY